MARLVVSRATNMVVSAEMGGDLMDLLVSFLTIPLGSVVKLLGKASNVGCLDDLFRNVEKLCSSTNCAEVVRCRALLEPMIATRHGCSNQLLDVVEDDFRTELNACADERCSRIPAPGCIHGKPKVEALQVNPKLEKRSTEKGGSFIRDLPGMFMATGEMKVMRSSSVSCMKFLNELNACWP